MSARRRLATGIAGGALLIAGVTVLARVVGFGRWLVFSESVGATCLGTAYSTANMLPNIVFEVVAGGALASVVVPLVGAQLARGAAEDVRRTASALLSWSLLVLVPLSLLGLAAAVPLMDLLVGTPERCVPEDVAAVAARFFLVFAPQMALYGVAVVCAGILNAHRRFLAAAAAPLVSSAVVVAAYAAFLGYDGSRTDVAAIPLRWELVLAIGTTGGVVALMLTMALPVARLRLRLRPTLRFPAGVATRARALALAGVATLLAQQLSVLVVIPLTSGVGGALNLYNYAWAVFLLPYAVLAVPIATAAFTALSEQVGRDDEPAFARTTAATTRAVVLVSLLGAGVLAGTAAPVAAAFVAGPPDEPEPWQLAWALVAFAPGLVGYGLVAHLGRVLYARHAGRAAATATVAGWLVVTAASVGLALAVPRAWTVTAIGAANSLGMLVAGGLLLRAIATRTADGSLAGLPRALLAGGAAAVLAALTAAGTASLVDVEGKVASGLLALGAGVVGGAVFAAVVLVLDGEDLRAVVRRRFVRA